MSTSTSAASRSLRSLANRCHGAAEGVSNHHWCDRTRAFDEIVEPSRYELTIGRTVDRVGCAVTRQVRSDDPVCGHDPGSRAAIGRVNGRTVQQHDRRTIATFNTAVERLFSDNRRSVWESGQQSRADILA